MAFATSSIRILKMIEAGVPKETLGLLNSFFQFIQILTPIFASHIFDLKKPLEAFLKIYPTRLFLKLNFSYFKKKIYYFCFIFKNHNNFVTCNMGLYYSNVS